MKTLKEALFSRKNLVNRIEYYFYEKSIDYVFNLFNKDNSVLCNNDLSTILFVKNSLIDRIYLFVHLESIFEINELNYKLKQKTGYSLPENVFDRYRKTHNFILEFTHSGVFLEESNGFYAKNRNLIVKDEIILTNKEYSIDNIVINTKHMIGKYKL